MNNDEEIAKVVVMWLWFVGVLFGASIIGLALALIEGVSRLF
jgi:hypothetical protein